MKKNKEVIILEVIFFIATAMYYAATENIVLTAVFLVICTTMNFFLLRRKITLLNENKTRIEEASMFIHSFVVSLSITENISETMTLTKPNLSPEFISKIGTYDTDNAMIFIDNLRAYFKFPVYDVFADTTDVFNTNGGIVLQMYSNILDRLRALTEFSEETLFGVKRNSVSISVLWALALSILVVCRFAIPQLYEVMSGEILFAALVLGIYLFIPLTYYLLVGFATTRKKE